MRTLRLCCLILMSCLLCVACQHNALTVRAVRDYYTPELQQKLRAAGWTLHESNTADSIDSAARKYFHLKRADARGGKNTYYIYYHEKTKQIVIFAREEINLVSWEADFPMVEASTEFTRKVTFPHYTYNEEKERYLKARPYDDYRLDALPIGILNWNIGKACKDFHDYEMKYTGQSVYENIFSRQQRDTSKDL